MSRSGLLSAERGQAPSLLGSVNMPAYGPDPVQWYGRNATARERLAYIAGLGGSLIIADFSNPAAPRVLSNTPVGAPTANTQVYRALIHGRYCYCACEVNKTVDVVDVTNPTAPVVVNQIATGQTPKWLYARGRHLFVGETGGGGGQVQVFDISNPFAPLTLATITVATDPYAMWAEGRYLFVGCKTDQSLRTIDLDTLTQVANVSTGAGTLPYALAAQGSRVYVVHSVLNGGGQGLQAWDFSNPAAPVLLGHAAITQGERSVAAAGDVVYTLDNIAGSQKLRVYDVTDPAAMVLRHEVPVVGAPSWIEVVGNLGLVSVADLAATNVGALQIWDLGGTSQRSLKVGSAEVGGLAVRTNAEIANDLGVGGGMDVGAGAHIDGASSVERTDGANGSAALRVVQRSTDSTATTSSLNGLSIVSHDTSTVAGSKGRSPLDVTWQKTGAGAQSGTNTVMSISALVTAGSAATVKCFTVSASIVTPGAIGTELTQVYVPGPFNTGTLAARYGVLIENPTGAGAFTGAHRGVYVKQLSGGLAGSIHAIYVEGTTRSFFGGPVEIDDSIEFKERASAPTPVADKAIPFARDDGSGKTQLAVQFPTGTPIVLGETGVKPGRFRGPWQASTGYLANDLVTNAGLLLSRIADGASGATIDLAQWNVVGIDPATTDARYQPQSPALVMPALVNSATVTSVAATVANRLSGVRVIVPRSGTLRDLTIFIGATSGNLIGTVYDTGDASAGNRTKLWDSGSVAAGGANAWQTLGDPNLAVKAGQQLDLGFVPDNGTVTFGRATTLAAITGSVLPTGFFVAPGGATPKLSFNANLASFAAPATITEANVLTQSTGVFVVIARIS